MNAKKWIAGLLALVLVFGGGVCSAAAPTAGEWQALTAALPTVAEYPSPDDAGVEAALAAYAQAVAVMAEASDEQIEKLPGVTAVCDGYSRLLAAKTIARLPASPISEQTLPETLRVLADLQFGNLDVNITLLGALSPYTSPLAGGGEDDPATLGESLCMEAAGAVIAFTVEVTDAVSALNDEQAMAVGRTFYGALLPHFPESFTVENLLDYADQYVTYFDGLPDELIALLTPEEQAKISRLNEQFAALSDQLPALTRQMEAAIAACPTADSLAGCSLAKAALVAAGPYLVVTNRLNAYGLLGGDEDSLKNIEDFRALEELLLGSGGRFGDVNADGQINAADALAVLRMAVGKAETTDDAFYWGDVNDDYKLNAADALLILKYAVGKLDHFPVEESLAWDM